MSNILIRVSEKEKAAIEIAASNAGLNTSAYLRTSALPIKYGVWFRNARSGGSLQYETFNAASAEDARKAYEACDLEVTSIEPHAVTITETEQAWRDEVSQNAEDDADQKATYAGAM